MTLNDTQNRYGLVSIFNHWATAVLIVLAIGLGWVLEDMGRGPLKGDLFALHMAVGLTILALAGVRLAWRTVQRGPEPAGRPASWQRTAARTMHISLLAMILFMPLSGILLQVGEGREVALLGLTLIPASGGEIEALEEVGEAVHGVGANLLIALVAVHVLAALKHHLLDRDATLLRMLGLRRERLVEAAE